MQITITDIKTITKNNNKKALRILDINLDTQKASKQTNKPLGILGTKSKNIKNHNNNKKG